MGPDQKPELTKAEIMELAEQSGLATRPIYGDGALCHLLRYCSPLMVLVKVVIPHLLQGIRRPRRLPLGEAEVHKGGHHEGLQR